MAKQKVAIQGGGPNYLGKQPTVSGIPRKWKSSPDHPTAQLAYITDEEKDILIDLDLYGSLKGKPNKGPGGVMSLQGDMGGYGGTGGRGGFNTGRGNQGGEHRGTHHYGPAIGTTPSTTSTAAEVAAAQAAHKANVNAAIAGVTDSKGGAVVDQHGNPISAGYQVAKAQERTELGLALQAHAKKSLISQAPPPKRATYQPSMTAINNEIANMQDRLGELGAMKDKSNEDLNELGELNSLFGLNPTEDMGLAESVRYNVTNEDFKSDLSQLANNPLFSFASAAMGNPLGIVSLIGKGIGNIYGAVTNPVDTVTSAAQSVGDWFGGLDVQPTPPESPGGGRPDPVSPLYYQTLGEETIPEEDMTGVMDYAPVYYGVNNWPGAISYAKNGGLASLVPKRRRV